MDFEWPADAEEFRSVVSAFLTRHLPAELEDRLYVSGVLHDAAFARALGERNWIMPDRAAADVEPLSSEQIHVLTEELTRADAPIVATTTSAMVAKVIDAVGPDWMREQVVPAVVSGEVTIALGMSEPEAGSDVAAIQSRARRLDEGWVVDGQKMFTTNAHVCDYVFLLVRTDPESERHRGLTTFLVPTDIDGFEAQAVYTMSGERTNITFFDDVRLDDRWRISAVGDGWRSLMIALQDEHSAPFSPHLARGLAAAEAWASTDDPDGRAPLDHASTRERLASVATRLEVARLLEQRCSWMEANGQVPFVEGPMSKLFSTEAVVAGAEELCSILGPDSLRSRLEPTSVDGGQIEHLVRYSLGMTTYAGTSEIQRNIIAQHRCGLPR